MASREAMNMGSRSSTVISEFKSVISLLGQATDSAFQKITSGVSKLSSAGTSGQPSSGNLVAPNPVFSSAPQISYLTETGSGLVASGPAGTSSSLVARGPTNLSSYAAQTGAATLYQPEVGSTSRGGGTGGGGGGGGIFGRSPGAGGTSGAGGAGTGYNMGLSNIPVIGSALSAAYALYNTASNLTPSTSDVLEAQLLQQRASFYTGGGKGGIGAIQASQQSIAQAAMLSGDNPQMDVLRAQVAAQSYGLTGPSSTNILRSAANVSNLMPGIGVEGAVRATGAMQQAYNVNMLRGIGIQLRGEDGTLKGPDAVIEDVWKKITRDYSQAYGANKSPSLKEVQISLQPGNALDSMLNQYFGNDPMLKQLVANGLLYKAQGGSTETGAMKGGVEALGGTTSAMLSYSSTAAAGQGFMTAAQPFAAEGFTTANQQVATYYNNVKTVAAMSLAKAAGDTVLTAFGGSPLSSIIALTAGNAAEAAGGALNFMNDPAAAVAALGNITKLIGSGLLSIIPGMASGGPVSGNTPYIVGEVGPELFVPDSNGTIIPNDKLGAGSTYNYSFTINAASGSTQDLVTEIKSILVQLETNKKVSEM